MSWNNIKITILKELRGVVRDKKSLHKLILYPLIIPLVILLFGLLFDTVNESTYTIGVNYQLSSEEKEIIKQLENITIKNCNNIKTCESFYKDNKIEGYIIRNDNKYTIYTDTSQNSGEIILSLANSYLDSYSKMLGNKYLMDNGMDPNMVFNNIIVDSKSLNKEDTNIMSNMIFSLVISYITMIVVMVCVVVVSDATSGEKERGTLETILTFPIRSSELVIGKYLATSFLSFIGGSIAYFLAIPSFLIGKEIFTSYEEITFTTSFLSILLSILVLLFTSLLASGICMALSGKAKTYKEAQSSLQFVSILPIIPYFLSVMEVSNNFFQLIPIANCSSLLNDIVINKIQFQSFGIIIFSTIIYIICILKYISLQYSKEETLFS